MAKTALNPLCPKRSKRDWIALGALMACSCFVFLWNLDASGYANEFYSAAAQAGSQDWWAFLWGSSDAGNSITVDKPPASIWVMALSVRLLGLSSFAILLPQALMGIACTYLLYAITRRYWGNWAGIAAGTAFTFTPVAALMFRFNNPDALLVLLMLSASACVLRAMEYECCTSGSRKRTAWLVAAGALIGLGFLTKQLQVFLVLPGFAVAMFAFSPVRWRRRFVDAALALAAMVVAGGWWVLLTVLVPSGSRPYIGGSQTDSFIELTFSYNGLGRLTGNETGSVVPGGGGGQAGNWGETGIFRLFSSGFNDQITWLALLAMTGVVVGILAALALKRAKGQLSSSVQNGRTWQGSSAQQHCNSLLEKKRSQVPRPYACEGKNGEALTVAGNCESSTPSSQAPQTANSAESNADLCRMRLTFVAVFGCWLVVTGLVFSFMAGIFHQYYTVALAPAVACMTAVYLQGLWELRSHVAAKIAAALLTAISSIWAFGLIIQSGYIPWLAYIIVVAGTGSAAMGLICTLLQHSCTTSRAILHGSTNPHGNVSDNANSHRFTSPSTSNAPTLATHRKLMRIAVAAALVALMAGPIAWTSYTISSGHQGSIVTAGPGSAMGGGGQSAPSDGRQNGKDEDTSSESAPEKPSEETASTDSTESPENGVNSANGNQAENGTDGSTQPDDNNEPPTNPEGADSSDTEAPDSQSNVQSNGQDGKGSSFLGGNSANSEVAQLLQENAQGYRWAAATTASQSAATYQLASQLPVMPIGGFNGTDPSPTLDQFKAFVEEGLVRYYLASDGVGGTQMGGSNAAQQIAEWVEENFESQTVGGTTVYDLTQPKSN